MHSGGMVTAARGMVHRFKRCLSCHYGASSTAASYSCLVGCLFCVCVCQYKTLCLYNSSSQEAAGPAYSAIAMYISSYQASQISN